MRVFVKTAVAAALGWFLAVGMAVATSVGMEAHTCPICKRDVQLRVLYSYSNFGDQPRNLSSMLGGIMSPQSCPWDLFTDYGYGWEKFRGKNKAALKKVLDGQTIELNVAEKKALAEHGARFFDPVKRRLWYRTCLPYLGVDPKTDGRDAFFMTLRLYYSSYEDKLTEFYRGQVIDQLSEKDVLEVFEDDFEKTIMVYLRAELLREVGRFEEAVAGFQKAVAMYDKLGKKSEKNRWLWRWSMEQSFRAQFSTLPLDELRKEIVASWLDSGRFKQDEHPEQNDWVKWTRHQVALQILTGRMAKNDVDAGAAVQQLIGSDTGRLLRLADMTEVDFQTLVKNAKLLAWLTEIKKSLNEGAAMVEVKDAQKRKIALKQLERFLGKSFYSDSDEWKLQFELMPHFERWRKAGGDDDPMPPGWTWSQALGGYKTLFNKHSKNDAASRKAAMMAFLNIVSRVPDQPKEWSWDLVHGLAEIAEHRPHLKNQLEGLLAHEWKGVFWKSCVEYLNGGTGAKKLVESPLVGAKVGKYKEKRYEKFLWSFLGECKDPVWKQKAFTMMRENDTWISSEVYSYLSNVFEPKMIPTLEKRIGLIRKFKTEEEKEKGHKEMLGYELDNLENIIREYHFSKLTYSKN